jgi:hypothetical protein
MTPTSLPRMLISETDGWTDLVHSRPSAVQLAIFLVVPMSLIPPIMHAFSQLAYPGSVFPAVQPGLSVNEAILVGGLFFVIELLTVALMTAYIRQVGELAAGRAMSHEAFTLAAVAPTPLWLAALALFIPNVWFSAAIVGIAWLGTAALIRHGVAPLFQLHDQTRSRRMANAIIIMGASAWIGLIVVLELLLSLVIGLR